MSRRTASGRSVDRGTVQSILWPWCKGGIYRITVENAGKSEDVNSPAKRTAALTDGGAMQKQRSSIESPGLCSIL